MEINIDIDFKPYNKQKEILKYALNGKTKYISVCTGRQVGKTLLSIFLSITYLINEDYSNIGFITPVYATGKKIFEDLTKFLSSAKELEPFITINKTELSVTFKRGETKTNKLKFFSAERYDNIRGNTFSHVIIDEAAYIKNEAFDSAIRPTTLVRCKKVILFSTPKGKNWFYDIFITAKERRGRNISSRYKSFNFSTLENPYISKDVLEDFKKNMPEDMYRQEILGEFLENGSEVFKDLTKFKKTSIPKPCSKHFIGIDIGQANDYTVITVLNEFGQIIKLDRFNKIPYDKIIERISNVLNKFPKAFSYIESNSVGAVVIDMLLKDPNLKNKKITPFITTNTSKNDMVENLIRDIEQLNIRLTKCDENEYLLNELETFTYKYFIRTRTLSYGAIQGFHDDMVISLALANKCRLNNKNTQVPKIYIYGNNN